MKAERPVAERGPEKPAADLAEGRVAEQGRCFSHRLRALGGSRGEVGNDALPGQEVGHAHEQENFEQPDTRERDLLGEWQACQRGPIERETAIGQQEHGHVGGHPKDDRDQDRRMTKSVAKQPT
jgi:hypothetical protein